MGGTAEGNKKRVATIKARYGDDFFVNLGRKYGKVHNPKKGFGSNPELAKEAGRKGGQNGRKRK